MKRSTSSKKGTRSISNEHASKDITPKTCTTGFTKGFFDKQKKSSNNLNIYSINDRQPARQLKNNFLEFDNKKQEEKPYNSQLTKNLFTNDSNSKLVKARRKKPTNTTSTAIPTRKENAKENLKSILNPSKFKDANKLSGQDFYLPFQKKQSSQVMSQSLLNGSSAFGDRKLRNNSFGTKESNTNLGSIFDRPISKGK